MMTLSIVIAQAHVIVDRLPSPQSDPILVTQTIWLAASAIASILVAAATASLALFTYRLARTTTELARDTVIASRLADRHHQETLRPILRIQASLSIWHLTSADGSRKSYLIRLEGELMNVGNGPATSVNVLVTPQGYVPRSFYLGMIGANNARTLRGIEWRVERTQQHADGDPWPFDLVLSYLSLFGSSGTTEQHSHSGALEDIIDQNYTPPLVLDRPLPLDA